MEHYHLLNNDYKYDRIELIKELFLKWLKNIRNFTNISLIQLKII